MESFFLGYGVNMMFKTYYCYWRITNNKNDVIVFYDVVKEIGIRNIKDKV